MLDYAQLHLIYPAFLASSSSLHDPRIISRSWAWRASSLSWSYTPRPLKNTILSLPLPLFFCLSLPVCVWFQGHLFLKEYSFTIYTLSLLWCESHLGSLRRAHFKLWVTIAYEHMDHENVGSIKRLIIIKAFWMHKIDSKSAHNKCRCSQPYPLVLHHVTSLTPWVRTTTCAVCAAQTAVHVVPTKLQATAQLRFQAGVCSGLFFLPALMKTLILEKKICYFPTIVPQHVISGLYCVRMFDFWSE